MDHTELLLYCTRAALFAAAVCALWGLWYALHRRRASPLTVRGFWLRFAMVFYLSALLQITVIRGADTLYCFWKLPHAPLSALQLTPLHTILWAWRLGGDYFLYQIVGNIVWFVPLSLLGAILWRPFRRAWCAILTGALISCGIEVCQWVFASGNTDVDDILLNTLGAALGWLLWAALSALLRRSRQAREKTK